MLALHAICDQNTTSLINVRNASSMAQPPQPKGTASLPSTSLIRQRFDMFECICVWSSTTTQAQAVLPPVPSYIQQSDHYRAQQPPAFDDWRRTFPFIQVRGRAMFDEYIDEHIQQIKGITTASDGAHAEHDSAAGDRPVSRPSTSSSSSPAAVSVSTAERIAAPAEPLMHRSETPLEDELISLENDDAIQLRAPSRTTAPPAARAYVREGGERIQDVAQLVIMGRDCLQPPEIASEDDLAPQEEIILRYGPPYLHLNEDFALRYSSPCISDGIMEEMILRDTSSSFLRDTANNDAWVHENPCLLPLI